MESTIIIMSVFGVLVGLWAGKIATDWRWKSNAYGPQRILSEKKFYKVVELGNKESEKLIRIHLNATQSGVE